MFAQIAIFVLSPLAIWLLSNKQPGRRGWIAGLASQPFWLYETYCAEQWGMLANAVMFTVLYARGLRNHWRTARPTPIGADAAVQLRNKP